MAWSTLRFISFLCVLMVSAQAADSRPPQLLVLGDSLSAAYGIPLQQGWVALLQDRLKQAGYPHQVVNASITGDTTGGGLARLPATLQDHHPALVVIELGGNDGLRGFSLDQMQANLERLVKLSRASGAEVLLLGVRLPANYGSAYDERFRQVYADVSERTQVPLVPFFLVGIAETRAGMQADGIHPDVAAQPRILDNIWPALQPLLSAGS